MVRFISAREARPARNVLSRLKRPRVQPLLLRLNFRSEGRIIYAFG
jgi:hypothetical protein